jgi:hypothetical protein
MDVAKFWASYSHLYHMTEAGSWPKIQRLGLLSTRPCLTNATSRATKDELSKRNGVELEVTRFR